MAGVTEPLDLGPKETHQLCADLCIYGENFTISNHSVSGSSKGFFTLTEAASESEFNICYRPRTKFAKVMFSQVSVFPWVEGGLSASGPWGCLPHPLGRHPPAQCMLGYTHPLRILQDTVNKQMVRIPLECILVYS